MKEQLLKAWSIHNEKNLLLVQVVDEAHFSLSLSKKSRTIGEQLAHLHSVRLNWIKAVANSLYEDSLLLPKEGTHSQFNLTLALTSSGKKIEILINNSWERAGKLPSFKAGLIPYISYLISHESHHRGNILLTLKQNGCQLPDKLKWGLWEWQK